jgi:hypothetical protein
MANFFSGVGQALPQAIGLMTNIQELQERSRHQRALEDFRQQEIGMKEKESALNVDLTKNQIAESQLKQRKGQLELGNMEKEQKELDLPRPVLSLPQIAQMDDEVRKNIIGMMTQFQAAEGDPNMPMTSMRKWNKFSEMIKGDKELFKKAYYPALASVEKMWMSLNEKIAKGKMEGKDVSAELEKAEVLRQRYVQMAAAYQGKMTDLEKAGDKSIDKQQFYLNAAGGDYNKARELMKQDEIDIKKAGPGKTIERTVDLGDKVEYHYTDGRVETKPKGKLPTEKEPNIWEKKWALSIKALKDEDKVDNPSITQISEKYKKLYGQEDFLMGILQSMGINGNNPLGIVKK